MSEVQEMRAVLMAAGYSRNAVERALQERDRIKDQIVASVLGGMIANMSATSNRNNPHIAVADALEYANAYLRIRVPQ
jgi:hypothetical protein